MPETPTTNPSGASPVEMGVEDLEYIYLSSWEGSPANNGEWEATGAVSLYWPSYPYWSNYGVYEGESEGSGNWKVRTNNGCGYSTQSVGQFDVEGGCDPCSLEVLGNPTDSRLQFKISKEKIITAELGPGFKLEGNYAVMD